VHCIKYSFGFFVLVFCFSSCSQKQVKPDNAVNSKAVNSIIDQFNKSSDAQFLNEKFSCSIRRFLTDSFNQIISKLPEKSVKNISFYKVPCPYGLFSFNIIKDSSNNYYYLSQATSFLLFENLFLRYCITPPVYTLYRSCDNNLIVIADSNSSEINFINNYLRSQRILSKYERHEIRHEVFQLVYYTSEIPFGYARILKPTITSQISSESEFEGELEKLKKGDLNNKDKSLLKLYTNNYRSDTLKMFFKSDDIGIIFYELHFRKSTLKVKRFIIPRIEYIKWGSDLASVFHPDCD
jgi:hypothetical protein